MTDTLELTEDQLDEVAVRVASRERAETKLFDYLIDVLKYPKDSQVVFYVFYDEDCEIYFEVENSETNEITTHSIIVE